MVKLTGLLVAISLLCAGCESIQPLVYNMTPCPITVVYSIANIREARVTVPPGESVGSFGMGNPRADDVVVIDSSGTVHNYTGDALARLRPARARHETWGYFDDGLRFLRKKPTPSAQEQSSAEVCK